MFSLSTAARVLAGERIVAALKASSSSVVAAFSTLPSSARVISTPLSAFSGVMSSRGLASRAGSSTASKTTKKSTSAKRSASKSKKSSSSKRSSSATRGTRSAKKTMKSKAVVKKLKQAMVARAAQKLKVRKAKEARRQRDIKERAGKKAKARLAKMKKLQTLMQIRQQKRRTMIAKNQSRRQKQRTIDVKRRLFQRVRATSARRRTLLEASVAKKLARELKFAAAHPKVAKKRAEVARGLPAAPKFPSNVYARFVKSNFAATKAELTAAGSAKPKPQDVLKALVTKFKSLPQEEKAKLIAVQAKESEQYELEKQKRQAQMPPKRPQTAYIAFYIRRQKDLSRNEPTLKFIDIGKRIGESWKALPESEKAAMQADAAKAVIQWKDELARWADSHPGVSTLQVRKKPSASAIRAQLKEQQTRSLTKKATDAKKKNKKTAAKKA